MPIATSRCIETSRLSFIRYAFIMRRLSANQHKVVVLVGVQMHQGDMQLPALAVHQLPLWGYLGLPSQEYCHAAETFW